MILIRTGKWKNVMTKNTSRFSMRKMIADSRFDLGMSLQIVANRAGITKSHLWNLEQGRSNNPTIRTVYRLAKALNIPFDALALGALNDVEQPR